MTVDGTDFKTDEPMPFDGMWCSHKINHGGLRYEIGISIFSGQIVWVNGPFPAGCYTDYNIAMLPDGLEASLMPYETYFADGGYQWCQRAVVHPCTSKLRARHENCNGMFKEFCCLKNAFRHPIKKHYLVAFSVMNIVSIRIKHQTPLNEGVDLSVVGVFPGPP